MRIVLLRRRPTSILFDRLGVSAFTVLLFLCALCGDSSAQDFKQVHPGVEYAAVDHKIGSDPVKINLLRLDLTKVRLDVHHALDKAIGLETTSSIAKRKGAVAAINAGFFRLDKSEFAGDAAGVLTIDKVLVSESDRGLPAIGIVNDRRETLIAFVGLTQQKIIEIDRKPIFLGSNRERKESDIVEYSSFFGSRTPSGSGCTEATIQKHVVVSVVETCGSEIPDDGFVISATGGKAAELRSILKIRSRVKSDLWTVMNDARSTHVFQAAEDVVSGRGHLLRDGEIPENFSETNQTFSKTRHPRTAVAKLKDGKFLMVTVDGRQPGVSVGMSLQELAEYLLSLGAVDAMNLDGGGSTTMYLDGKVVNTPSDKEGERRIGDAIVVTLRKK